jgi:hypothetical protein
MSNLDIPYSAANRLKVSLSRALEALLPQRSSAAGPEISHSYQHAVSRPIHPDLASTRHLASHFGNLAREIASEASDTPTPYYAGMLEDAPAAVISSNPGALLSYRSWFKAALNMDTHCRPDIEAALDRLRTHPRAWSILIIEIDGLGGITAVIDQLMDLRKRVPEIPVIVVTSEIQSSDYSTERLAICDVTLREPVWHALLEIGLGEAIVNNMVWRVRQIPAVESGAA